MILAGPKQISIYDPNMVTLNDLGRNFYAKKEHVGKVTRAQASISELKDLNPNAIVDIAENCDPAWM